MLRSYSLFFIYLAWSIQLFSSANHDSSVRLAKLKECIKTYSQEEKNKIFFSICKKEDTELLQKKLKTHHSPRTIMYTFLNDGIVDINIQDEAGQTALHIACKEGQIALVKDLLGKKSNPNIQDNNGQMPLHIACKYQQTKIVEMLMKAQADCSTKDKRGKYPRDLIFPTDDWVLVSLFAQSLSEN